MSPDWSAFFSLARWKRGVDHFIEGRLLECESGDDDCFHGRVAARAPGGSNQIVSVRFDRAEDSITAVCTCSARAPCEHAAALMVGIDTALVLRKPDLDLHQLLKKARSTDPVVSETEKLREWLTGLRLAPPSTPAFDADANTDPPLLYVIKTIEGNSSCAARVEPIRVVTSRTPTTETVDLDRIVRDAAFSRPAWISAQDIALWIELRDLVRPGFSERCHEVPATARGAAFLDALVATGRCRWDDAAGPPVRAEAPRTARWAWQLQGERLSLALAFDAGGRGHVLPFAEPRYLDGASGSYGTVELTSGPRPCGAAPTLSLHAARDLDPEVRRRLQELALPEPTLREVVDLEASAPVPVIQLSHDADVGATAALTFDYGGHRLPLGDPGVELVTLWHGDTILRIPRSPDREAAIAARLAAAHLYAAPGHPRLSRPQDHPWPETLSDLLTLEQDGARVEFDTSFPYVPTRVDAVALDVADDEPGWFSIGLGLEIDGQRIDALPAVIRAIEQGRLTSQGSASIDATTVLQLDDGRLVAVPTARLTEILDVLVELHHHRSGRLRLPAVQRLRLAALTHVPWVGESSGRLARMLREVKAQRDVAPPRGLRADLRPYQRAGFAWLQKMRALGLGALLADDMGLGKTLQTLAHILKEKLSGQLRGKPALVVCPTSVVHNWAQEAARFAPTLRVLVLHGSERTTHFGKIRNHDLVITSYALLRLDEVLREHTFHIVVLDEAQNIKNLGAKVTQAAKALRSTHRVALSGTPVENHLGDLYSILDFVQPGVLGSPDEFRELYRRPIERHDDAARMKSLSDRVAPLILRRTKAQVLSELPSKTEIIVYADLAGRQRDLYETVRLSMEERVRSALQNRGFAKSQIVFLDALLKLRQVCCDPRLVKLPQASRVTQSAKLEELLLLLEQLLDAGRRVVLFSQFTSMLAIIARRLDEARVTHLQLTGRTRDRAAVVEAFSRGEASVFLVSLKAGGSGLNLTHADTVIHYDPWWNPAVEDQASDRVHRLGQTENVTVFKLVCRGSVEERILALHAHKRRLARGAQGGATEHGGRFDLETFEALLRPLDE